MYNDKESSNLMFYKLFEKQLQLKKIGTSSNSVIFSYCSEVNGKRQAFKVIEHDCKEHIKACNQLSNENDILSQINHPYIIKTYAFQKFKHIDKNFCVLHMDLYKRDLYSQINKCFPQLIQKDIMKLFFKMVAEGIRHLHCDKNVVHLDIKPENIFLKGGQQVKAALGDFGFASFIEDQRFNHQKFKDCFENRNTLYLSPEILQIVANKNQNFEYFNINLRAIDIYAFGLTLFVSIFLISPQKDEQLKQFMDNNQFEQFWNHNQQIKFLLDNYGEGVEDLKDIIQKCLVSDPNNRINIKEFIEHSWFKGINLE